MKDKFYSTSKEFDQNKNKLEESEIIRKNCVEESMYSLENYNEKIDDEYEFNDDD